MSTKAVMMRTTSFEFDLTDWLRAGSGDGAERPGGGGAAPGYEKGI